MYVTRRHSDFFKTENSNSFTESPPGPNSGFLVLHDYDREVLFGCFGGKKVMKTISRINYHPFPQNCVITIGMRNVMLIPVLDQPLSSNLFYVIETGKPNSPPVTNSWLAFTSWGSEDDFKSDRFKKGLLHPILNKLGMEDKSVKPKKAPPYPILKPLDLDNKYQQFRINRHLTRTDKGFYAKCIAPNGQGPQFLTHQHGIYMEISLSKKLKLVDDALGIDSKLRGRLPPFDFDAFFGVSDRVIVGKWYSSFVFINTPKKPMEMFYEIKLEQRWERFFTADKYFDGNKGVETVNVDVELDREVVFIDGKKADESDVDKGYIWYTNGNTSVGLNPKLVERMKFEQAGGGWYPIEEKTIRIHRVDEAPNEKWMVYGCYVLVERFIIRTLGGKKIVL